VPENRKGPIAVPRQVWMAYSNQVVEGEGTRTLDLRIKRQNINTAQKPRKTRGFADLPRGSRKIPRFRKESAGGSRSLGGRPPEMALGLFWEESDNPVGDVGRGRAFGGPSGFHIFSLIIGAPLALPLHTIVRTLVPHSPP